MALMVLRHGGAFGLTGKHLTATSSALDGTNIIHNPEDGRKCFGRRESAEFVRCIGWQLRSQGYWKLVNLYRRLRCVIAVLRKVEVEGRYELKH